MFRRSLIAFSFVAAVFGMAGWPALATQPVDLELALAVDVSTSIDEEEARLQREGYVAALRHPDVIAAIRSGMLGRIAVTYFEWAGDGQLKVVADWTLIDGEDAARRFADRIASAPLWQAPRTSIAAAIQHAVPEFRANGFEGTRQVIDISGDGPSNGQSEVLMARDRAIAEGITINGLPIMNGRADAQGHLPLPDLDLYYRDCVIGGPGAFMVVARSFQEFGVAIRRKMVTEIAGLTVPSRATLMPAAALSRVCDFGLVSWREIFIH